MIAKLLKHRGIYFLYMDEETIVPMRIDDVKEFLSYYTDDKYYYDLIERYSIPALKRRFSSEPDLLAIVDDEYKLVIHSSELLKAIMGTSNYCKFISTEKYAAKHGKGKAIVLRMCREGRIEGAVQVNSIWIIPEDAPYPSDGRLGSRVSTLNTTNEPSRTRIKDMPHAFRDVSK